MTKRVKAAIVLSLLIGLSSPAIVHAWAKNQIITPRYGVGCQEDSNYFPPGQDTKKVEGYSEPDKFDPQYDNHDPSKQYNCKTNVYVVHDEGNTCYILQGAGKDYQGSISCVK